MDDKWPQQQLPSDLIVPSEWEQLVDQARQVPGRLIIIGNTDVGKSTLCWWLAEQLAANAWVAVVDADLGQSRVGPPAAVGWRFVDANEGEFYFVGDTTPARRPASCLCGTVRLVQRAEAAGAEMVIIDTSGYVQGPGAISLKTAKIELLRPTVIIVVSEPGHLSHLISPFARNDRVSIVELLPAGTGNEKTRQDRQKWRQQRFATWLMGSSVQWLSLADRAVINLPSAEQYQDVGDPEPWRGLLVGLLAEDNLGLCLGLLRAIDYNDSRLLLTAPQVAQQAAGVHLGCLRLEPDGSPIPGRPKYV